MTQSFIPPAKPIIGEEGHAAVDRVLHPDMIAQGPEVAAFETEFSEHFRLGRACMTVGSGTSGLHLGLLSCRIGADSRVIVPSFTFVATANSITLTGATPVFADVPTGDFTLDPVSVEASIMEHTKAVMPVHLYGHPAQMDKLCTIADSHSLLLLEGAAQMHDTSLGGTPVKALGEFAMFSLYPTKSMTSGEGGMISHADATIKCNIRLYRNQGTLQRYHNEVIGLNNHMTDTHAAISRVQLTKVDAWMRTRQENAAFLSASLEGVTPSPVADGAVHVYHQYTTQVSEDRGGLARALKEEYQTGSRIFYPTPNHRLKSFRSPVGLPGTERAAKECLSLPIHPSLTQEDLERIVNAVNTLAKAGAWWITRVPISLASE